MELFSREKKVHDSHKGFSFTRCGEKGLENSYTQMTNPSPKDRRQLHTLAVSLHFLPGPLFAQLSAHTGYPLPGPPCNTAVVPVSSWQGSDISPCPSPAYRLSPMYSTPWEPKPLSEQDLEGAGSCSAETREVTEASWLALELSLFKEVSPFRMYTLIACFGFLFRLFA